MDQEEDELVSVIPIHYSNNLAPNIQIHQFPLLTRPLLAPPSAVASGKRIKARIKPHVRRLEIHVPADTRPEVWNNDRGKDLGVARAEDDREKNQETMAHGKLKEGEEPRLGEVRLRSEEIKQKGVYMLGIVRDGQLHLHPINEVHQFRPTLTYLDQQSKRSKRPRGAGSGSESDDGPPPDPDEPAPVVVVKEKKPAPEAKEVQVSARKTEDKGGLQPLTGGLSVVRREMLAEIRAEEDEVWREVQFFDGEALESGEVFESIFSRNTEKISSQTKVVSFLKDIPGL